MTVEVAAARRNEIGGHDIDMKRTLERCANPVPVSHMQMCVIGVSYKIRRLDKTEKGGNQLPYKTGNNPTNGLPITVKCTLSSDRMCHHIIVWAWKNRDI